MAKKNSGFIGTFGGNPKTRWSNVLSGDRTGRGKPARDIVTPQNIGILNNPQYAPTVRMKSYAQGKGRSLDAKPLPPATGEASVTPNRRSMSVAGGLGIQAYGDVSKSHTLRTPREATTATRDYQYGNVMGAPSVVRTTVDMKTSPVKTAPIKTAVSPKETSMSRAQRIVAERQAAGPRMAGGKNVSYGFGSAKALGQSIAKSFGGGGQRSGGGMGGGMRSGGGRATDPSRGGMGNSGRGTGSKK